MALRGSWRWIQRQEASRFELDLNLFGEALEHEIAEDALGQAVQEGLGLVGQTRPPFFPLQVDALTEMLR